MSGIFRARESAANGTSTLSYAEWQFDGFENAFRFCSMLVCVYSRGTGQFRYIRGDGFSHRLRVAPSRIKDAEFDNTKIENVEK